MLFVVLCPGTPEGSTSPIPLFILNINKTDLEYIHILKVSFINDQNECSFRFYDNKIIYYVPHCTWKSYGSWREMLIVRGFQGSSH